MIHAINNKTIFIKRRIDIDENKEVMKFIFHNINYRRKIYNLFVEKWYECDENWIEYNPNKLRKQFIDEIDHSERNTDYYCSDIVLAVYKDIKNAVAKVKANTIKKHVKNHLRFRKFDYFKGAFKVRSSTGLKSDIQNPTSLIFRAAQNNHININLREPLYDYEYDGMYCTLDKDGDLKYYFYKEDIKEVAFIHELGKFFISLCVNVSYVVDKEQYKSRKKKVGIDLGIHNPVTLYDGEKSRVLSLHNDDLKRIHYLERRCKRLQAIMDRKMLINKKRHKKDPNYKVYTRNYRKVQWKFRRTWKRICDIRNNWRKKLTNQLALSYKKMVVDFFEQPTKDDMCHLPNKVKRYINHFSREHGMYLFSMDLVHNCEKYGTKLIDSPDYSTRTCSCCGHINPKLPLSKRKLFCEECGEEIDRDINAAINCYESI